MLLWWNRQTRYVRFGCTRAREVWVHADLPVSAVDERRASTGLLGLLVEGARGAPSATAPSVVKRFDHRGMVSAGRGGRYAARSRSRSAR